MRRFTNAMLVTLTVLLCVRAAAAAPVQRIHQIQRPLFSAPAIVKAGGSFTIEVKPAEGESLLAAFLASLDNPAVQIGLKLSPKSNGAFDALVPANAAPALYNLSVRLSDYDWDSQPHAVKVIKDFKNEFDFIQFTDIHFNHQYIGGLDMNRIRRRILQDLSKEDAEFVVFSGDLGLDPETYDADYVYAYEELLYWLRQPTFMVPGNHELYYAKTDTGEIDGRKYWDANYGPTFNSFDYGKLHVIGINSFDWPARWRDRRSKETVFFGTVINAMISPRQWDWVKKDLEDAKKRGLSGVAYTHIPVETLQGGKMVGTPPNRVKVPGPGTKEFAELLTGNGVEYLFVGHMHYNEEKTLFGLKEVLTKGAGIAGGHPYRWAYRIIHVKDGKITGWKMHEIGLPDIGEPERTAGERKERE
jgi:hypothetical protein